MTSLSDLTSIQIRALAKLDDGHSQEDSVGQEIDALPDWLLIACYELAQLGLVEVAKGWRGTTWFRLTATGRAVRSEGRG